MRDLDPDGIPAAPGVYALYRDGERQYVGEATRQTLRDRLWRNHRRTGTAMTNSALRRNVAELQFRIATAADIKAGRYVPSADEARLVSDWIAACEVAWIECSTGEEAHALEAELKREHRPPLTKR
jgi:hypothetical protein